MADYLKAGIQVSASETDEEGKSAELENEITALKEDTPLLWRLRRQLNLSIAAEAVAMAEADGWQFSGDFEDLPSFYKLSPKEVMFGVSCAIFTLKEYVNPESQTMTEMSGVN